jgi:Flp pilus assembly protein TadG
MIFAFSLPVLLMLVLGGIDLQRVTTAKAQFQDALDAATLAAARSPYTEPADLKRVALIALRGNLQNTEVEPVQDGDVTISLNQNRVVVSDATGRVKTLVANIVLPPYGKILDDTLSIGVHSEVNRAARNLEVAMVLDITGSMKGTRLSDLKTAAKDLIDLVVQTEQSPFYSKIALVPYSMGVNAGDYADRTRGALTGSTAITGAAWAAASGKSISSISRANPAVVTANGHGLTTGDYVWITGVSRMTDLNGRAYQVTVLTANTFRLNGINTSSGYSNNGSGGTVTECQVEGCNVVVTSANHGLETGEYAKITDVVGMVDLNATWIVNRLSNNSFWVPLVGPNEIAYTRGGKAQCGRDGCAIRLFLNQAGGQRELPSSTCVSERSGSDAYKDTAPGAGRWVGRNYPSNANPCLTSTIYPLSSNISKLKSEVDGYVATGSTAGQIGVGWGWYMVSPNFGSIWPSGSVPGPVNVLETLKAVVIMTDGEFNNPYCQGVISQDAVDNGSAGSSDLQINCSAPEGDPFTQSVEMCKAMKAAGVVVYTVGFDLDTNRGKDSKVDTAIEVMETCATTKDKHFFQPTNGTGLKDAFRSIGQDISRLRISR